MDCISNLRALLADGGSLTEQAVLRSSAAWDANKLKPLERSA